MNRGGRNLKGGAFGKSNKEGGGGKSIGTRLVVTRLMERRAKEGM